MVKARALVETLRSSMLGSSDGQSANDNAPAAAAAVAAAAAAAAAAAMELGILVSKGHAVGLHTLLQVECR
jgi:hypothetical protein